MLRSILIRMAKPILLSPVSVRHSISVRFQCGEYFFAYKVQTVRFLHVRNCEQKMVDARITVFLQTLCALFSSAGNNSIRWNRNKLASKIFNFLPITPCYNEKCRRHAKGRWTTIEFFTGVLQVRRSCPEPIRRPPANIYTIGEFRRNPMYLVAFAADPDWRMRSLPGRRIAPPAE